MAYNRPTASLITLGCRANQYESDAIAAELEIEGFEIVSPEKESDICIINTCTVTAESDRKSRQMIRRAAAKAKRVIVTGCFAELSSTVAYSIDGVDLVISNKSKSKVAKAAFELVCEGKCVIPEADRFEGCDAISGSRSERVRTYIKIEDGCDNNCAYCIIPKARGPVRSKSPALIIKEAQNAVKNGIKEIILTGIEISRYGSDLKEEITLTDVAERVAKTDGLMRVSLGSLDPKFLTRETIERFAGIPGFVRHFHLSIQSGCTKTLRDMRRKYNADQIIETVDNVYSLIPDAMISVDAIAGFPGESEEDFAESASLLRRIRPLHIHSFPFSVREGTEAASMKLQVPESEKKRRNRILCDLSYEITRSILEDYAAAHRNDPVNVLCESVENGIGTGHSEHFAEVKFECEDDDVGKILSVLTLEAEAEYKNAFVKGRKAIK